MSDNVSSTATLVVSSGSTDKSEPDGKSEPNDDLRSQYRSILSKLDSILMRDDWKSHHVEVGVLLTSCLLKLKLWSVDIGDAEDTLPKIDAEGGGLAAATADHLQMIATAITQVEAAVFTSANISTPNPLNPLQKASNLETLVTLFKLQVDPFRNTRDLVEGTGVVTILQQELQRISQELDSITYTGTPIARFAVAPPPTPKDVNPAPDLVWGDFPRPKAKGRKDKDKSKTSSRSKKKISVPQPPPVEETSLSAVPALDIVPEPPAPVEEVLPPPPPPGEDIVPPLPPPPLEEDNALPLSDPVEVKAAPPPPALSESTPVRVVEDDDVVVVEEHSPPPRRHTRRRHSAKEPDAAKPTTVDEANRPPESSAGPRKASKRHETALIRYDDKMNRVASTEQNAQVLEVLEETVRHHSDHEESPESDRRSRRRRSYQAYVSDGSSSSYYSGYYSPRSQSIESGSEGFGSFADVLRHTPRNLKSEEILLRRRTYHKNRDEEVYVEYAPEVVRRLRSREGSNSRIRGDTERSSPRISRKHSRIEAGTQVDDSVVKDQGHGERSRSREHRPDHRRKSGQREISPSLIASIAEPVASAAIKLIGEQFTIAPNPKSAANAQRNGESKPDRHAFVQEEHVELGFPESSSKEPVVVGNPPPQEGVRVAFELKGADTNKKEGKSMEQQPFPRSQQDNAVDGATQANSRNYIGRDIDEEERTIDYIRRDANAYRREREGQRKIDWEIRIADLRRQEAESKKRAEELQRIVDRLKTSTKATSQESKTQEQSESDDEFSKDDWRKLDNLLSNAQQTYSRWLVERRARVPGQPNSAGGRPDDKLKQKAENLLTLLREERVRLNKRVAATKRDSDASDDSDDSNATAGSESEDFEDSEDDVSWDDSVDDRDPPIRRENDRIHKNILKISNQIGNLKTVLGRLPEPPMGSVPPPPGHDSIPKPSSSRPIRVHSRPQSMYNVPGPPGLPAPNIVPYGMTPIGIGPPPGTHPGPPPGPPPRQPPGPHSGPPPGPPPGPSTGPPTGRPSGYMYPYGQPVPVPREPTLRQSWAPVNPFSDDYFSQRPYPAGMPPYAYRLDNRPHWNDYELEDLLARGMDDYYPPDPFEPYPRRRSSYVPHRRETIDPDSERSAYEYAYRRADEDRLDASERRLRDLDIENDRSYSFRRSDNPRRSGSYYPY